MVAAVKINRRKPRYAPSWKDSAKADQNVLGNRCESCGCRATFENPLHRHHIIHKAKRGPDALINLKLLCKSCHERAHAADRKKR